MNKRIKWLLIACLVIAVFMGAGYLGLAAYYRGGFLLNTWINDVYCTGRTVEEINAELTARTELPESIVVEGLSRTGEDAPACIWVLSLRELDYAVDYEQSLNQYFAEQNAMSWAKKIRNGSKHYIEPSVSYHEEELEKWWQTIEKTSDVGEDYRIEYAEEKGYSLYDGMHNRLDAKKAFSVVSEAVVKGKNKVDLVAAGCYYDSPLNEEQAKERELWKKIDVFQSSGPIYDLADEVLKLDAAVMAGFLQKEDTPKRLPVLDENGNLKCDKKVVDDFVDRLAQERDTYGKEWDFPSTRGEVVKVKGGNYGTTLDRKAEKEWLAGFLRGLAEGKSADTVSAAHVPAYTRDAFYRGSSSVGDTYIEVDMGTQKLYYYEKGEIVLETDVVTGSYWSHRTPEGVNAVQDKLTHRVLRGPGYVSPVEFWMPVKGAIGIHDADWRDTFGGEYYKTDGSHGCVNVPAQVMPELFEMTEIGTPVIMFYGSDL